MYTQYYCYSIPEKVSPAKTDSNPMVENDRDEAKRKRPEKSN